MSVSVLGIDIAKQKFDAALLVEGKTKHKTCNGCSSAIFYKVLIILKRLRIGDESVVTKISVYIANRS